MNSNTKLMPFVDMPDELVNEQPRSIHAKKKKKRIAKIEEEVE